MKTPDVLSVESLIRLATEVDGTSDLIENELDACEAMYMNGVHDEQEGDTDTVGHYYRFNRWIVQTDSQGFKSLTTFDTEPEAITHMEYVRKNIYTEPE